MKVYASDDKMNACFVTINSSEEKHLFKKKLSEGKNSGKFNFHELVPGAPDQHDWFKMACEKNIRCDILVVSGHFGGSFFGSSKYNLSMSELEKRSCKNDCKEVMSSPKEVFLLGCNTLAGKEEDNRSASEYLDVLLADDIPMAEASRIVEQRYGAVGTSFKDSMKRAFKGVPHIYGFHSVGPSGKNIEGLLNKYHKMVPNYYDHLVKVEVKRGLALMDDFTKWNQENNALAQALRITHFAQTSGVLIPCEGVSGLAHDDPVYEILNNICKLKTGDLNSEDALEHTRDLLLRDDFALYLPAISEYISSYSIKEELEKLLKENPVIKENIMSLLEDSKTGFGKLKVAKIAMSMGIISKGEFEGIEKGAVLTYLAPPVSVGSKDAICSYNPDDKILISRSDVKDAVFVDPYGLMALECLEIDDRQIVYDILKTAKNHKNRNVRKSAIFALMTSNIYDEKVVTFLENKMLNGETNDEKALGFFALASFGKGSEKIYNKLLQMFSSGKTVRVEDESLPEYKFALYALDSLKLKNYEHLKKIYAKWKALGRSDEYQDYFLGKAVSNLSHSEMLKFFNDEGWGNGQFRKKIRKGIYTNYYEDKRKVDNKMPVDVFDYYVKDAKRYPDDNSLGLWLFSRVDIKSSSDEEKFIKGIKNAKFSKEKVNEILQNLPKSTTGTAVMSWLVELHKSNPKFYTSNIATYLYNREGISSQEREILKPLLDSDDSWMQSALKQQKVIRK